MGTDSACTVAAANEGNSLSDYKMEQFSEDKHCYFHKGYSMKLSCGSDDTVVVDHWLDLTGKLKPCLGTKMAGEALMKDVPWEIALDFFNGDCVRSADYGNYGKLTAALPSDGFPKCDFTGASIRRLGSHNATNNTNATAAPTPAPTPATPAPTPAPTNATVNTTNTTAPTPAPAAAPTGTASGTVSSTFSRGLLATVVFVFAVSCRGQIGM